MKWRAKSESLKSKVFEIEYDPFAGFYIYIYQDGVCIADYLQDTLEQAIGFAMRKFNIPKDIWEKTDES